MDKTDKLIGRGRECEELKWAMDSHRSELIVLYGRRRVGKTFLVRRFFNDTYCFHYVGAHNQKKAMQLQNFREALVRYSSYNDIPSLQNWHDAFVQLEKYLESCSEKRKVVFFDEMPWMDTQGSDFVAELEYFWANWVLNRDDIVFIACGSETSWMKEKIEDNQGGLHNRITHRIYLRPFYLNECKAYLEDHGFEWDDYQILQCYMLFGGVPYYLSLLRPYLSLPENVDALIFRRGGDLSNEFKELYNALFRSADRYIVIVKLLSTKRQGFLRGEIEKATGFGGGGLTTTWNVATSSFPTASMATRAGRPFIVWPISTRSSISAMWRTTSRVTNSIGNTTFPTEVSKRGKGSHSKKSVCVIFHI